MSVSTISRQVVTAWYTVMLMSVLQSILGYKCTGVRRSNVLVSTGCTGLDDALHAAVATTWA